MSSERTQVQGKRQADQKEARGRAGGVMTCRIAPLILCPAGCRGRSFEDDEGGVTECHTCGGTGISPESFDGCCDVEHEKDIED